MAESGQLYGLLGRFEDADALRTACRELRRAGFGALEAYSPFPVPGLSEDLGMQGGRLPLWALIGGIVAATGSYLLQYYAAVHAYPINVGGRPLNSWPAFIPISIEFTLLGAAVALVLGLLFSTRLPRLHHPLFDVPGFERATQDGFFLCVRAADPNFDQANAAEQLRKAGALSVQEVAQ